MNLAGMPNSTNGDLMTIMMSKYNELKKRLRPPEKLRRRFSEVLIVEIKDVYY